MTYAEHLTAARIRLRAREAASGLARCISVPIGPRVAIEVGGRVLVGYEPDPAYVPFIGEVITTGRRVALPVVESEPAPEQPPRRFRSRR